MQAFSSSQSMSARLVPESPQTDTRQAALRIKARKKGFIQKQ
jgi:hypothetical protein